MTKIDAPDTIRCPSAQPSADGLVIGVVTGSVEKRRIGYLTEPRPVTDRVLALAGPAEPARSSAWPRRAWATDASISPAATAAW